MPHHAEVTVELFKFSKILEIFFKSMEKKFKLPFSLSSKELGFPSVHALLRLITGFFVCVLFCFVCCVAASCRL